MTESDVQNLIRNGITDIALTFRANVGIFKTADGRLISTGLPKGFSDLFGFRKSDNKIIFLEVKTEKGIVSKHQLQFIETMRAYGCIAGVVRNVEEARSLILYAK